MDRPYRRWRKDTGDTRRDDEEAAWHARYAKPMKHFHSVPTHSLFPRHLAVRSIPAESGYEQDHRTRHPGRRRWADERKPLGGDPFGSLRRG